MINIPFFIIVLGTKDCCHLNCLSYHYELIVKFNIRFFIIVLSEWSFLSSQLPSTTPLYPFCRVQVTPRFTIFLFTKLNILIQSGQDRDKHEKARARVDRYLASYQHKAKSQHNRNHNGEINRSPVQ